MLLELFTLLMDFIKAIIQGIIDAVVKPILEGLIQFLISLLGPPAAVIKLALFAVEAAKDIISAIMKLLGIPPFMDIIIGILTPIVSIEPVLKAIQATLEPIFGLLEDIEEIIAKCIEFLIKVLTFSITLPLGILALLFVPVMAALSLVGTILATLTPTQELTIPMPIPIPA